MTGPVTTEALVERERQELVGLSNHLRDEGHLIDAENIRKALSDSEQLAENCRGNAALAAELRRRLDATEAALQQVTAERDEHKQRASDYLRDIAEDADLWTEFTERLETAEASLATVTSELARLRAEGEELRAEADNLREALAKLIAEQVRQNRTALARAATAREGQAD